MRYIGAGGVRTGEAAVAMMEALIAHRERHGFGLWAIVPDGAGRPVGWAGLAAPAFLPAVMPAVEVDYGLGREARGRGYATEAARAALDARLRHARPRARDRDRLPGQRPLAGGRGAAGHAAAPGRTRIRRPAP